MKTTSYPGALPRKFFPGALYDGVTAEAMARTIKFCPVCGEEAVAVLVQGRKILRCLSSKCGSKTTIWKPPGG